MTRLQKGASLRVGARISDDARRERFEQLVQRMEAAHARLQATTTQDAGSARTSVRGGKLRCTHLVEEAGGELQALSRGARCALLQRRYAVSGRIARRGGRAT